MGMVAENTRDYATAAKMLSSVAEEVRQRPESVAALARAYYHLGDEEKARGMLAQLSGAQPMLLGAAIADEMHDYRTAETMLESLRSQAPGDVNLEFRLALVQYHAASSMMLSRFFSQPLVRPGDQPNVQPARMVLLQTGRQQGSRASFQSGN
jgi:thioredoxin-like negative regulator of GroEL